MIKDDITLDSFDQDTLLNLSDDVIDAILYIAKDLICKNGMANVYAEDIIDVIDNNWGIDAE